MGDPKAPVIPIGVEIDAENLVVTSRGDTRHDYRVILKDEDMGRIRAGYVCARCLDVQEKPFPKKCWVCGFPMADKQSEFVAKGFQGSVRVGPSTTIDEEVAFMDEWEEIQKRKQDPRRRGSQILLPGKDF